ncbi:hypothetical protein AB0B01_22655 [Streptomyces sp. NPDC044571]|uniref:hypothetical protein n=1 Tax=Streptomyces sp. NPDC044571 TaxID=3155371 RepID=UPI0033C3C5EC
MAFKEVDMAGTQLTARESALWDQLVAELDDGSAAPESTRTRRPETGRARRLGVTAVLLPAAVMLLVSASLVESEPLAWGGVMAWIGAVLTVSHIQGHGPRLPWRR